tara:strand:- start:28610 stop:29503 length:894 start_codon:yes stop_codon:yes gene_type:complete
MMMKRKPEIKYLTALKQAGFNQIDYAEACRSSSLASILIEDVKDAIPLSDLTDENPTDFSVKILQNDFLYILFIVYQALSSMSDTFTHYDLHDGNVLLYEPVPGKYIVYHYVDINNQEVVFKTSILPKIIDYGRSFFDNGTINSHDIYKKVCDACFSCGQEQGFAWLDPYNINYGICSSFNNPTHDLRLLNMIKHGLHRLQDNITEDNSSTADVLNMINQVQYKEYFGNLYNDTIEESRGVVPKIYNVNGAYKYLRELVMKPEHIQDNEEYYSSEDAKLGDLYIYADGRPMKYDNVQ